MKKKVFSTQQLTEQEQIRQQLFEQQSADQQQLMRHTISVAARPYECPAIGA